jgi:hypothetical protein
VIEEMSSELHEDGSVATVRKYTYVTNWDQAAALLCEGTILEQQDFSTWQQFKVDHPKLGQMSIVLSVFGSATVNVVFHGTDEAAPARVGAVLRGPTVSNVVPLALRVRGPIHIGG